MMNHKILDILEYQEITSRLAEQAVTAPAKSKALNLQPATATVWNILDYAHRHHYDHVSFMDVGLPLHKNHYRDFILQFGGKPVSTYRWFRCSIGWINKALAWIYRE